jgi:hypothetical protein
MCIACRRVLAVNAPSRAESRARLTSKRHVAISFIGGH